MVVIALLKKAVNSYYENIKVATRNSKLFLLSCFFFFLGSGALRVIFNLYVQTMGYSEKFIGSLNSVKFIVAGIIAIPAAILATRVGYKKTLIFAGGIGCFTIIGIALSSTKNFLMLFNTLWGASRISIMVITAPFIVKNSKPEERSHLFGINFAIIMITGMISKSTTGYIVTYLKSMYSSVLAYRITLFGIMAITFIGLIPLLFLKEKPIVEKEKVKDLLSKLKKFVARDNNIRKLIVYSTLIGIGAGTIVPLFNIFLYNKLAATDGQIGIIMALANIATAIGGLGTPFLIKRMGKIKTIFIPQMISIVFLLMIAFFGNIYLVGVAYCLRMAFMNMANPVIQNFSMELVPEIEQANTSSIMRSVRRIGRGIGSFLSGIFLGAQMYILPFLITAVLYLAASFFFLYVFKHHDEPENEQVAQTV